MADAANFSDIFFLLKQADLHITQLFEAQMNISLTRYELLIQLKKQDYVTQRTLQEKLKIDQAAITRHLKILEDKGYIIRERNADNKREVIVHLSDQGKDILQSCDGSKAELIKTLFNGYSTEQLQLLQQFLTDFNQQAESVFKTIEKRKDMIQ
ncbi:MarR family transcriptional regulator [Enterococcus sp. BWM-S5]|uniref:MarR family transcriptional regulator n=1 Tax=Enterococcus larvae TaxID=2794352 RepID=A0ABS4CIV6_9ENTE|nr:MarR family transcriptional regulator [Enterococcus larvae]MBP1046061.1 MarR family transcriptional regulator [Enterococcus larvae]